MQSMREREEAEATRRREREEMSAHLQRVWEELFASATPRKRKKARAEAIAEHLQKRPDPPRE